MINTTDSCSTETSGNYNFEFHLELDRLPEQIDVNDINCCRTVPQVTLESVQLTLHCTPSPKRKAISATAHGQLTTSRRATQSRRCSEGAGKVTGQIAEPLIALLDGSVRSLVCRKPPRLTAGVRRSEDFESSLQAIFPAVFVPACLQAISTRTRLLPSILQSLQSYRRRASTDNLTRDDAAIQSHRREQPSLESGDPACEHSALERRIWSTLIAGSSANQRAPYLRTIRSSVQDPGLTEKLKDSRSNGSFAALDNDQYSKPMASAEDLATLQIAGRKKSPQQAPYDSTPDFEEDLLELSIVEENWCESWALGAASDAVSSDELSDDLLEELHLLNHPNHSLSSHHDSVSVSDYPLRDAACRSVDALLGHAPLLIEEGFLHDDAIGCETTHGSPQSEMIGWDMELSQTATRCSPLTSCLDMTEHEPLSGTSINASHPHEDLSDSHITHSTPVISSQNSLVSHYHQRPFHSHRQDSKVDLSTDSISDEFFFFDHENFHFQSPTEQLVTRADDIMPHLQKPEPLHLRTEAHRPEYFDARPASKRSSTASNFSAMSRSPSTKSSRGGKLLRHLSKKSKSSDEDMLAFDPSSDIGTRSVEIKRRKTLDDYDMNDQHYNEEDDEMLFQ